MRQCFKCIVIEAFRSLLKRNIDIGSSELIWIYSAFAYGQFFSQTPESYMEDAIHQKEKQPLKAAKLLRCRVLIGYLPGRPGSDRCLWRPNSPVVCIEGLGKEGCRVDCWEGCTCSGCNGDSCSCSWSKNTAKLSSDIVLRWTPLDNDSLDFRLDFSKSKNSGLCKKNWNSR